MEIELKKAILVNGFGGLPLPVGSRIQPRTVNEAQELVNKGYARQVVPGERADVIAAACKEILDRVESDRDGAQDQGEDKQSDIEVERTKPLPRPAGRPAGK